MRIRRNSGGCTGGCLGGCFSILGLAFAVGIIVLIFSLMKGSEPYQEGVAMAISDPRVNAVLGEPVEAGWWVMGSIETSTNSGNADLTVPLNGSRDSGRLYLSAYKTHDRVWQFTYLQVEVNNERIELLER